MKRLIDCHHQPALWFALNNYGSLGIAGVRGRCGGIFVVPPQKYPHITSLPRRFPNPLMMR